MMMSRLPLAATLFALMASASLAAPAAAQRNEDAFALGLGLRGAPVIFDDDFLTSFAPRVYLAFPAGEGILVEPYLGFFRVGQETENDFGTSSFSASVVSVGAGLLFTEDAGTDGRIYWGPRVGIGRFASDSEFAGGPGTSRQRIDVSLAGVAGGEFFLVPRLGLGGEAGLEWTRLGDDDEGSGEQSGSIFATTAELRLRWYLK